MNWQKSLLLAQQIVTVHGCPKENGGEDLILVVLNAGTGTTMMRLSPYHPLNRCEAQDQIYCESQEEKAQNKIFIAATYSDFEQLASAVKNGTK